MRTLSFHRKGTALGYMYVTTIRREEAGWAWKGHKRVVGSRAGDPGPVVVSGDVYADVAEAEQAADAWFYSVPNIVELTPGSDQGVPSSRVSSAAALVSAAPPQPAVPPPPVAPPEPAAPKSTSAAVIVRLRAHIVLHGAIVVLIGLLYGIPFGMAVGEEAVRSWRVAHSGVVTAGLMLIAIGAVLPHLRIATRMASLLVWSLVTSAYSFTVGVLVSAMAGVGGLAPSGSAINGFVFVAYTVGSVGALLGVALTICGAFAALRGGTTVEGQ